MIVVFCRNLTNPCRAWQQRVACSEDGEGRNRHTEESFQGGELGECAEHLHGAGDAEAKIVGSCDGDHLSGLAAAVSGELRDGAPERLIEGSARGRDQDRSFDPVRVAVRELHNDGTTHRVADKSRPFHAAVVEEADSSVCQVGDVEAAARSSATAEARQIRNEGVKVVAKFLEADVWDEYLSPDKLDDAGKQDMVQLLTVESDRVAATITSYDVDRKVNNTRTADPTDPTLIEPVD